MDLDLELVAEGLEFPEGPIAMADGSVILTEIAGALTRVSRTARRRACRLRRQAQRRGDRAGWRDLRHQQRRRVRGDEAERPAHPRPDAADA